MAMRYVFLKVVWFPPVTIIPPILHTHISFIYHWYCIALATDSVNKWTTVGCANKRCYNEQMLQWTVFINKIRMLQRTRRNTTGQRRMCVGMTCQAFLLWLERQSSSLLSFVRFCYQFSSVSCLLAPLAVKIFFKIILLHNFSHEPAKQSEKAN
jgi:hypothetical protein